MYYNNLLVKHFAFDIQIFNITITVILYQIKIIDIKIYYLSKLYRYDIVI